MSTGREGGCRVLAFDGTPRPWGAPVGSGLCERRPGLSGSVLAEQGFGRGVGSVIPPPPLAFSGLRWLGLGLT